MPDTAHKSGYAAIIGKPNAGKSTLMNRILGSKISIATHKAQTTRHQIAGIYSDDATQIIFLDTPGIITPKYELQNAMMATVERAQENADLVLFIFDPLGRQPSEEVIKMLSSIQKPLILVVNKMDEITLNEAEKAAEQLAQKVNFHSVVYLSALAGTGIDELIQTIRALLLPGPAFYPKDELSEQPLRFFVSELIREQIFLLFHEEIPYSCTVQIVEYKEDVDIDRITAEIIVNKSSQKGMLIGKSGSAIKNLGIKARESIENFLGKQVFLDLHVKVREKWREKENWVRNMGY